MGFFGSLLKTAMDIVETPVAIVKDVATMGGVLTDQDKPYTIQKLEEAGKDWDKAKDSLDKDDE
jgi:hypothetical protein